MSVVFGIIIHICDIAVEVCDVQEFYSRFHNVECQTITVSLNCRLDTIIK